MEEKKVYIVVDGYYELKGLFGVYDNENNAKLVARMASVSEKAVVVGVVLNSNPPPKTGRFRITASMYCSAESYGKFEVHLDPTTDELSPIKFVKTEFINFVGVADSGYEASGVVEYNVDEDPYEFRARIKTQVEDEFKAWMKTEEEK